ncbi:MAG: DoxX family membrane protein [Desulfobacterales bacterium]|nr:DoxX family membrane protein [Desulfobacterales bacterium]
MHLLIKILTHKYLAFIFRLYIAGLFIYASMYKINYTAEFAETIASYQMVPYWGVNIIAATLPWTELICGILLAAGIRARSAAVVIIFLLLAFTAGIAVNLLRDSPISCGCFTTLGETISWQTLVRDIIWVIMTVHIFFYDKAFHLEQRFSSFIKEMS